MDAPKSGRTFEPSSESGALGTVHGHAILKSKDHDGLEQRFMEIRRILGPNKKNQMTAHFWAPLVTFILDPN